MPRHSPCALSSLTVVGADSVSLATAQARSLTRSVAPPLPRTNASLVCARSWERGEHFGCPYQRVIRDFGSLKNYAGNFTEDSSSRNCYPHLLRCCPQLKLKPSVALLITFLLIVQFSRYGANPLALGFARIAGVPVSFETRLKYSIA